MGDEAFDALEHGGHLLEEGLEALAALGLACELVNNGVALANNWAERT